MPRTTNYVWYEEDLVGTGGFSNVYKGQCEKTGEYVAIKIMKNLTKDIRERLMKLQKRELDVLQKLDHPNIVKLIAVEDELAKVKKKVIIMEFCTGGNLYDIIQKPENTFGLSDDEFIKVIHGVASGMKELKLKNIIHRDIKPGNIMKCIGRDGRPLYKLIDFGAARELHMEEVFESVLGTDEYMDPRMYEKHYVDKSSTSTFTASVDLWSIGVTLYHVATGRLPFQAFKDREDKSTMFRIIDEKKSGQISGVQSKDAGPIMYSEDLPPDCILSRGLRPLVVKLLAGLLENTKNMAMSFDDFFQMAECIVNKKVVSVFDNTTAEFYKVYFDPYDNYNTFQTLLYGQCQTPPDQQILLFDNLNFSVQFDRDNQLSRFSRIDSTNPVYSFSDPNRMLLSIKIEPMQTFYNLIVDHVNESKYAFNCLVLLNAIKRHIDELLLRQKSINDGATMFGHFLAHGYENLITRNNQSIISSQQHVSTISKQMSNLHTNGSMKSCEQILETLSSVTKLLLDDLKSLSQSSQNMKEDLKKCIELWVKKPPACQQEDCCSTSMNVLINKAEEILTFFMNFEKNEGRKKESIELNKRALFLYCSTAKKLIENHCQKNTKELFLFYIRFMKDSWSFMKALDDLEQKLNSLMVQSRSKNEVSQRIALPNDNNEVSQRIALPNDNLEKWKKMKEDLEKFALKEYKYKEFKEFVRRHNGNEDGTFETLDCYFNEYMNCEYLLSGIAELALKIDQLFATKSIEILKKGQQTTLTLTQLQVACLMAHAFFCTYTRLHDKDDSSRKLPTINFSRMYHSINKVFNMNTIDRFTSVLHYFSRIIKTDDLELEERKITFHRQIMKGEIEWRTSKKPLRNVEFESVDIDDAAERLKICRQVVYTNKFLGESVFGSSRTYLSELTRFVAFSELLVTRLFTEELDDNECLIVTGVEKFSKCQKSSLKGDHKDQAKFDNDYRRMRQMVTLNISGLYITNNENNDQCNEVNVIRELKKAYCSFTDQTTINPPVVATEWSCCGDEELYFIIQLMAASQANRDMCYCGQNVQPLYKLLSEKNVNTVGSLYELFLEAIKSVQLSKQNKGPFEPPILYNCLKLSL